MKDFVHWSMLQNSKHTNQGSMLRWNKMSTQQQDQHWNAGVTEAQQLNLGGPDQRQASSHINIAQSFF